jgi:hypothetical protein
LVEPVARFEIVVCPVRIYDDLARCLFSVKGTVRGVIKTKPENANIRQIVKVRENFVFKEI